jgi:hypothetical protein
MKSSQLTSSYLKKASILAFYLKLILGLGAGLALSSSTIVSSTVSAQTDTDPFPGQLIVEGTWPTIRAGHELINLGHNLILDRELTSGQYRIWRYDPTITQNADEFLGIPLAAGTLSTVRSGHQLIYLGGLNLLAWEPTSGQYRIWRYDPAISRNVDPLSTQSTVEGTFSTIRSGHRLISLSGARILAWEPASGQYQIWRYDPTITGKFDSFPGRLIVTGTWPTIRSGHELIYVGSNRILDWEPVSGHYRIWRYDPVIRGNADPLSGKPVAEGTFSAIHTGHKLIGLNGHRILAWEPASGHFRVWQYKLTALGAFSLEDIATRLSNQTVTGVTVITHGFQYDIPILDDELGDSLMPLAEAIRNKAGGWVLDYDVPGDGEDGFFDTCTSDCGEPAPGEAGKSELVLLFDWAPESNELADGWGEAAGDALFAMLVGLGLIDPAASEHIPLHFIGHSFGTAVTSEAVERLARLGVPVDHVTYLDPHDFDQENIPVVDESQRLFDLGKPPCYGASVWNNVAFADVYYQTKISEPLDPEGRPIPGAYSKLTNNLIPTFEFSPHSYVWECFYRGTVMGQNPDGCNAPVQRIDYSQTGYAFSRIKNTALRPTPNFYSTEQDHFHSEPTIVHPTSGLPNESGLSNLGLTVGQITQGRWESAWNPLTIINGNFENLNFVVELCEALGTCPQPGWTHHGGGGSGHFLEDHTIYLELDLIFGSTRTHNWFYIPPDATHLQFDLWRVDGPLTTIDRLEVQLGEQTLDPYYELRENDAFEDAGFINRKIEIPTNLRGQVTTLTFKIVKGGLVVGSQVRIDNVGFLPFQPGEMPYRVYLPFISHSSNTCTSP